MLRRVFFPAVLLFVLTSASIPALSAATATGPSERIPIAPFLDKFPRAAPGAASGGWQAVDAFPQLTFDDPVALEPEPGTNRLYICGRQGTIHVVVNDPATTEKILLLDLANVTQGYDDCGLLSLAFHPEFGRAGSPNRGYFYICYQFSPTPFIHPERRRPPSRTPGYNRVARFTVPDGWFEGSRDPAAVRATEQVLINQFDEHVWHSLGGILFGDDGFLYVSIGDEGSSQDAFNNAQKINDGLFAGVLRIDVNQDPAKSHPIRRQPQNGGTLPEGWPDSFTANYFVPNDNPWVDETGANLEEFWAIGLRNPYRMTYDPVEKRIWVGDIGQTTREEVNVIRRGGNYQWAYREGTVIASKPKPSPLLGIETPPVYDYDRARGDGCVIGGYVYRGSRFPELVGKYIFADNTTNRIFTLSYDGINQPAVSELTRLPWPPTYSGLTTFGLDHQGELYVCKLGRVSKVYRLDRVGEPVPEPPSRLSETAAFADLKTLTPAAGILPYEVNSPLWSDGAAKRRWLAIPNDGAPYAEGETIGFARTGAWAFPSGTVFIKHFELPIDETNPSLRKRLETRFLVREESGGVYGVTYRWRADGSDADLLTEGATEEIVIKTADGSRRQTWSYPSRIDCMTCHNANAGHVLGVNTRQLNGDCAYPVPGGTSVTDNQLRVLNRLGLFTPALNEEEIASYDKLVEVTDTSAPLEQRVRSYLDANCAQCHRPEGAHAYFDARYDTPLTRQGLVNGQLSNPLGVGEARVITPRQVALSVLHARVSSTGEIKMPSLARNVVDTQAVAALVEWINTLSPEAGTRRIDRIAVLTNKDLTLEHRARTRAVMYLSERARALDRLSALEAEEIGILRGMLLDPDAFVVAHVLLSEMIEGITAPEGLQLNGMVFTMNSAGTVFVDAQQRHQLAAYWAGKLASP